MLEHIPLEIQSEIMKRLPVKSLIRFRSICKLLKSLIDSSDFIKHYISQQQHLFVSYYASEQKYVSIVDDHTFPQHNVSLTVPEMVKKMLKYPRIISTSHGLVCLYCYDTKKAVIWNLAIRKSVVVVVPTSDKYETALGFGVCRQTSDLKIVKIAFVNRYWGGRVDNITCIPSQVEVFTLSTGAWRSPYHVNNLPRKSTYFYRANVVVLDGVVYWLASDSITLDGVFKYYKLIISFDMTSEEFREITLPDGLSDINRSISMSYLGNSLVLCEDNEWAINREFCVWIMGGSVSKSFTKLFTITVNEGAILKGFQKSGEPIIAIQEEDRREQLVVYKHYSKPIHLLGNGIDGKGILSEVFPYLETLFLLDQPDNMVYNGI